jgi:hypothetical protein
MPIHPAGRSAILLTAALVVGACGALARSGQSQTSGGSLVVENRTGSEVVVYSLQSLRSVGTRLGNVRSFATETLSVPRSAIQGANEMMLRVHAIAGGRDWNSPRISLNDDLVARLDIRSDGRGDMSSSAFYTMPPP